MILTTCGTISSGNLFDSTIFASRHPVNHWILIQKSTTLLQCIPGGIPFSMVTRFTSGYNLKRALSLYLAFVNDLCRPVSKQSQTRNRIPQQIAVQANDEHSHRP